VNCLHGRFYCERDHCRINLKPNFLNSRYLHD
jgi:hypothetical protein